MFSDSFSFNDITSELQGRSMLYTKLRTTRYQVNKRVFMCLAPGTYKSSINAHVAEQISVIVSLILWRLMEYRLAKSRLDRF